MRQHLTFILFLIFSANLSAQSAKTAFITDAEITWLDQEITGFEANLAKMKEAVSQADSRLVASNKTAIMKSINRLSTNCNIMNNKILTEIDPPAKQVQANLDSPPDYLYNKKKKQEALQELKLTENNIYAISEHAAKLKTLKDNISAAEYSFHPKFGEASAKNLEMAYEMLAIAKTINSIIQRSQVD